MGKDLTDTMQFFLVLVAVLVATATAGSRLPVAALATNKAKINNKELVMKLRGGGMITAIGPLNAGLICFFSSSILLNL